MSKTNYMTIRQFSSKYNIEGKAFARAVSQARSRKWKGMMLETRFSPGGEYLYPEASMKKIAWAMNLNLKEQQHPAGKWMTTRHFRKLCPGLPREFSSNVARYCQAKKLVKANGLHKTLYPFEVLQKYARKAGKLVLGTPEALEALASCEKQKMLPFLEAANSQESTSEETRKFCERVLSALAELNDLVRNVLLKMKGEQA